MLSRVKSLAFALAIAAAVAGISWIARNQETPSDPLTHFFNSGTVIWHPPEIGIDPPDTQFIPCG